MHHTLHPRPWCGAVLEPVVGSAWKCIISAPWTMLPTTTPPLALNLLWSRKGRAQFVWVVIYPHRMCRWPCGQPCAFVRRNLNVRSPMNGIILLVCVNPLFCISGIYPLYRAYSVPRLLTTLARRPCGTVPSPLFHASGGSTAAGPRGPCGQPRPPRRPGQPHVAAGHGGAARRPSAQAPALTVRFGPDGAPQSSIGKQRAACP